MSQLPEIVLDIGRHLHAEYHPERVLLFGSWAKGTATPGSDIDVLVVTRKHLSGAQRDWALQALQDFPVKVDVVFCTEEELQAEGNRKHSFLHSILQKAVPLGGGQLNHARKKETA